MPVKFRSNSCFKGLIIGVALLAVVGTACLIAGIVMISKSHECEGSTKRRTTCGYSTEAQRVGLGEFLQKVQDTYYELHPHLIATKPNVRPSEVREKFSSYDPSPMKIKVTTDKAWELLSEIKEKTIISYKLKPRERKALAQIKHFLLHVFGNPYDVNYYAGDFLLGPNLFCWQPICKVVSQLGRSLGYFKPATVRDMELLKVKLETVNHTFTQYIENLKYGPNAGMVRSEEECKAGIQSFKNTYWNVSEHGAKGIFLQNNILKQEILTNFINNTSQMIAWTTKYGVPVNESLRNYILEYVGKPLHSLLRYLDTEYLQHCVPSNVSSGLATLPIAYVYVNGSADLRRPTTKKLKGGEPLNGTRAYEQIMSFFTTTEITPDEVHELGYKMLYSLYPQVLDIARAETNQTNNVTAKEQFTSRLNESDMYFLTKPIPVGESNSTAHRKCHSAETARKYCPVRWKAMQNWFREAYQIMSLLDPKTVNMFYFTGEKHTTPNCPVKVTAKFNPASGVPSYRPGNPTCSRTALYLIPFFLERPGPRFNQWSVNAHESRPGHHTQVQGFIEHFRDSCGGLIGWLDSITSYTAFSEGWALYAENPLIAKDTDVYNDEPLYKYGMLRSQIWRALRLVVDTGLHYKGFSRQKAFQYFVDYVWDEGDVVKKEITRYQSDPGQATSYMIGQLHIMKLRSHARTALGKLFDLKEFHYHLLKHGSAPLSYLTDSINEYIRCTKEKTADGCEYVLGKVGGGEGPVHIDLELLVDHVIERHF